jgi:aminoglycoside phosphotransferase family enzyme/predicted kinase
MILFSCYSTPTGVDVNDAQLRSLLRADAYPEPAHEVRLIQTHVSWIFLAGDFAYKVKKPVDFGFLNFTTLDRRRFYCQEEVRLNRRLCPEIYLDVIPLRATDSGLSFNGDGMVVDYAVKMVRLPAERMAGRLLENGELTAADVARIAATVADFHQRAERGEELNPYGSPEAIGRNWDENLRHVGEFVGLTINRTDLNLLQQWGEAFMASHAGLFFSRIDDGHIRDCDGDLHLENICLTDRVQIFDCIEFNNRFRYSDTAADIAFLLMDLENRGRKDLADLFLEEYLAASGDRGAEALLPFYKTCRAVVRGKVESLRLRDATMSDEEKRAAGERAARYFRLALGYALRERLTPAVIVICGLSGSGKSTIAAELSRQLGVEVFSSDVLRKQLAGIPPLQRNGGEYGSGLYSSASTEATYGEMVKRAESLLSAGRGVILDATFRRRDDRQRVERLARAHGVARHLFLLECPEETVRQRLEQRMQQDTDASDAGWEVYLRQKGEFEPLAENEVGVVLDGGGTPAATVERILASLGLTA